MTPEWPCQPPLPWHGPEGQVGCTECGRDIIEAATHPAPSREGEAHPAHRTGPGLWTCHACWTVCKTRQDAAVSGLMEGLRESADSARVARYTYIVYNLTSAPLCAPRRFPKQELDGAIKGAVVR